MTGDRMPAGEPLGTVLDWVALRVPASVRAMVLPKLTACYQDGADAVELWRTLAEELITAGHMDIARDALKQWQLLAPPDHPLHAVLGGPPKPEPVAPPPMPKKEEPNSRIVRVIDMTYTFKRIPPEMQGHRDKKVVSGWETYLAEEDRTSRAVLNEYDDGTFAPWAVSGVFSDFAGAAAVEVVVRSIQRHFVFTNRKDARTRRILVNLVLPGAIVVAALFGYLMGLR